MSAPKIFSDEERAERDRACNRAYAASDAGRAKQKDWRDRNREKVRAGKTVQNRNPKFKEYQRWFAIGRRYGLSRQDYAAMYEAQSSLCAICKQPPSDTPKHRALCVDHCHATGVVRGLLCDSCNNGLARFKDDPARLLAAVAYLSSPLSSSHTPDGK